jgi:hypothetical protein
METKRRDLTVGTRVLRHTETLRMKFAMNSPRTAMNSPRTAMLTVLCRLKRDESGGGGGVITGPSGSELDPGGSVTGGRILDQLNDYQHVVLAVSHQLPTAEAGFQTQSSCSDRACHQQRCLRLRRLKIVSVGAVLPDLRWHTWNTSVRLPRHMTRGSSGYQADMVTALNWL